MQFTNKQQTSKTKKKREISFILVHCTNVADLLSLTQTLPTADDIRISMTIITVARSLRDEMESEKTEEIYGEVFNDRCH